MKNIDELKKAAPDAKIVYVGADEKNLVKDMKKNTERLSIDLEKLNYYQKVKFTLVVMTFP